MHTTLTTVLSLSLSLTLTFTHQTTAVPFSSTPSPSTPRSTSANSQASDISNSIATLIASDASASYDPNTCPPSHGAKQCCTSITSLADDLTSQLGGLVPVISGVSVSSLVGLQCTSMADTEPNENCLDDVMCCSSSGKGENGSAHQAAGTQSLFKSGCISYDEAIQDKKDAIAKSKAQASYLAEGSSPSSSSVVATPTSKAMAALAPAPAPTSMSTSTSTSGGGSEHVHTGVVAINSGFTAGTFSTSTSFSTEYAL
ncbi:hypothetical protein BDW62DRAFT_200876 [Aspergillus aurantiobrunneus]